jgi:Arc/MetJ-type ribon-helix-helix transcriptional regulator
MSFVRGYVFVLGSASAPLYSLNSTRMAKKPAPAPSPLTLDLPVSLLEKVESQRKKLGFASTSEVLRYAIAEYDLSTFKSNAEERRQISIRLSATAKAELVKASKKLKASLGEILRSALEALPEDKLRK